MREDCRVDARNEIIDQDPPSAGEAFEHSHRREFRHIEQSERGHRGKQEEYVPESHLPVAPTMPREKEQRKRLSYGLVCDDRPRVLASPVSLRPVTESNARNREYERESWQNHVQLPDRKRCRQKNQSDRNWRERAKRPRSDGCVPESTDGQERLTSVQIEILPQYDSSETPSLRRGCDLRPRVFCCFAVAMRATAMVAKALMTAYQSAVHPCTADRQNTGKHANDQRS